ncbi:MAG: MATE family efflux transporter, partial [Pseudomonadota bacterium]
IDVAVIGRTGGVTELAAVGLGAEIFALVFLSFNFLQFGVSGLSAQALGAGAPERLADTLGRGLIFALTIALALTALQAPLKTLALGLFEASAAAEGLASDYFDVRIWAAPAALGNFAFLGWFAGQAMTGRLLRHQLVISGVNIALSILFVVGFGWGVEGVALGTAIGAWTGLAYAIWMARGRLRDVAPGWRPRRAALLEPAALRRMAALNRDLLIRTLLLLLCLAWMTRLGSLLGDATLAANVVLFQFFVFSAAALDGFAMAGEALVGQALGARSAAALDRAAWRASALAGACALALAAAFALLGPSVIDFLTAKAPDARAIAQAHAHWALLTPLIAAAAFQMDGIFIGATASVEMRNAMIAASLIYLLASFPLHAQFGNHGVWAAVWIWLGLRAVFLLALYPRLRARAAAGPGAG